MITHNIGPTTILVCESTANCLIYNPTETYLDQIVNYVVNNNYTCGGIYHNDTYKSMQLQKQVGGKIFTDEQHAISYEKTLC